MALTPIPRLLSSRTAVLVEVFKLDGRPNFLPERTALSNPALTRSRINERSN